MRSAGIGVLIPLMMMAATGVWLARCADVDLFQATDHAGDVVSAGRLLAALWTLFVSSVLVARPQTTQGTRCLLEWSVLLLLLVAACDTMLHEMDGDTLAHLTMTWMMGHGELPYRDFFDNHQFLWHVLCIPLMAVAPQDLRVVAFAQMLMFCVSSLLVLVTAVLAERSGGNGRLVAILLLSLRLFLSAAEGYRADTAATCMLVLFFLALRGEHSVRAGVCLGLAFALSQKSGPFGCCLLLGALLGGRLTVRRLVVCLLYAAGVAALPFLVAAAYGILPDYWEFAFAFNSRAAPALASIPYWQSGAPVIVRDFCESHPLLLLLLAVAIVQPRTWGRERRDVVVAAVATTALVCLMLYKMPENSVQYGLLPLCLLAVVAGAGVSRDGARPSVAQDGVDPGPRDDRGLQGHVARYVILSMAFLRLLNHAATPGAGLDLGTAEVAFRALPRGGTLYGIDTTQYPVFCHNASFNFWRQENLAWFFSRAPQLKRDPRFEKPDLRLNPPDVMILGGGNAEQILDELRRAGILYRFLGAGVWKRQSGADVWRRI